MSNLASDAQAGFMTPQTRIKLIFLVQSIAGGALITRIPDLQTNLGLDETALGITMMGQALGALIMHLFSAKFIEAFGNRRVLLFAIPLMAFGTWLIALMPNAVSVFIALMGFAACFALSNVAMNVEADRIEAQTGSKVMSQCHGIWAFGYLFVGLLGVAMRGLDVSMNYHFLGLFLPTAIATFFAVSPMIAARPRAHNSATKRPVFAAPTLATLTLVAFGLAGTLAEMSTRVWSIIFMRDSFDVPAWVDSLTLPIFALLIASARMVVDGFLDRVGTVRGARLLLATAISGVILVAVSPHFSLALLGFGLMGIGICASFPLMLSAAAQLGDRPAAENVAAATFTNTLVMLVAPAAFGVAAGEFGLRAAFWMLVPFLLISFAVAGILAVRDQSKDA